MRKYQFKDPRRGYDYKIKNGPMACKNQKKKTIEVPWRIPTKYVETYMGGLFGGYYGKVPLGDPRPLWMQIIELIGYLLGTIFCLGCAVFVWCLF